MNWKGKPVLVVGGAGFLGSSLAERLVRLGALVDIIDNFSTGLDRSVPSGVRCTLRRDATDEETFGDLPYYEYIFNFGSPCSVIQFDEDILSFSKTVAGFMNVLRFANRCKARCLLFPSSGSVYGQILPQSENDVPNPPNLYGLAKLSLERIANSYSEVSCLGLRVFAGFGPGELEKGRYASVVTLFATEMISGRSPVIMGDGSQRRDFIYISDVVESFVRGAELGLSGILNVGSGTNRSFNEVVEDINRILGTSVQPILKPKPRNYLQSTLADTRKMKSNLGIDPMHFEASLERYLPNLRRQLT